MFCIPNSIDNKYGVGTNYLIKKGAKLVTSYKDILNYYNIKEENIGNTANNFSNISEEFISIYKILGNEPIHINNICKKLNIKVSEASAKLIMMELQGIIKEIPHKGYIKCWKENNRCMKNMLLEN